MIALKQYSVTKQANSVMAMSGTTAGKKSLNIYVDMGRQFPSRNVLLQRYAEVAYLLDDSQYSARSERNFVLS